MRIVILIIFLISIKIICGQSIDTINNKICIKLAPLAYLDIYSGMSPRIGIEFKVKNTFAIYNEIGTYISGSNSMQVNKGILTKIEFKKYFNYDALTSGNYVSAELFYKHQSFRMTDSIFVKTKYEKEYSVTKDVSCLTIKYGKLYLYKYRFIVDIFVGLGLRYKNSTSTLTSEENKHIVPVGDYHLNLFVSEAGKFFYPNFDAGVKIGYRIK